MEILSFILGLVGIWFGAHLAVDQALIIANKLKISKLFVGLTVLSIGTSLPEIFTHIIASLNELNGVAASNIAIGNSFPHRESWQSGGISPWARTCSCTNEASNVRVGAQL